MKVNPQIEIVAPDLHPHSKGNFNAGEHLRVEIEPGKHQTISCKLPNGKFVTFAFCPANSPTEMECVDIHTTVAMPFPGAKPDELKFPQHLLGFSYHQPDTFDTRKADRPTTLATLLLHTRHYQTAPKS